MLGDMPNETLTLGVSVLRRNHPRCRDNKLCEEVSRLIDCYGQREHTYEFYPLKEKDEIRKQAKAVWDMCSELLRWIDPHTQPLILSTRFAANTISQLLLERNELAAISAMASVNVLAMHHQM